MKLNELWKGCMFEITAHDFHLSADQLLHTFAYLSDVQNIYTRSLKNREERLLAWYQSTFYCSTVMHTIIKSQEY
jgi:hypothetical protein